MSDLTPEISPEQHKIQSAGREIYLLVREALTVLSPEINPNELGSDWRPRIFHIQEGDLLYTFTPFTEFVKDLRNKNFNNLGDCVLVEGGISIHISGLNQGFLLPSYLGNIKRSLIIPSSVAGSPGKLDKKALDTERQNYSNGEYHLRLSDIFKEIDENAASEYVEGVRVALLKRLGKSNPIETDN